MRTQMQSIYDLFVARVAHGRHMEVAKVREIAEGRIWSGNQGFGNGLVDELGGLSDALAYTRKLTGLNSDVPVTVEGSRENLLDSLFLGDDAGEADAARALARLEADPGQKLLAQVPPRAQAVLCEPLATGRSGARQRGAALLFGFALKKRPTIRDVAQRAGVSTATVSFRAERQPEGSHQPARAAAGVGGWRMS